MAAAPSAFAAFNSFSAFEVGSELSSDVELIEDSLRASSDYDSCAA